MMTDQNNKSLAQKFNEWRVFPRLMALVYLGVAITVTLWFTALPDPSNNQAAFAGGVTGMMVPLLTAYMATGPRA